MLLRTEIVSTVWNLNTYVMSLPRILKDEEFFLDVTFPTIGKICGSFIVDSVVHVYENERYTQRLYLIEK